VSVFAEYIFHEPSDITCHAKSPAWISDGISTDLLCNNTARESYHFDANQTGNMM
jgi:hypothetical protein